MLNVAFLPQHMKFSPSYISPRSGGRTNVSRLAERPVIDFVLIIRICAKSPHVSSTDNDQLCTLG